MEISTFWIFVLLVMQMFYNASQLTSEVMPYCSDKMVIRDVTSVSCLLYLWLPSK